MRRRWYEGGGDVIPLEQRPVSLVKDQASKFFGDWTTNWADSGWVHPGPRDPDGEGPATPSGSQSDGTLDTIAVPVRGSYLVVDGHVYAVHDDGAYVQIKATWRQRWSVTTDTEPING